MVATIWFRTMYIFVVDIVFSKELPVFFVGNEKGYVWGHGNNMLLFELNASAMAFCRTFCIGDLLERTLILKDR